MARASEGNCKRYLSVLARAIWYPLFTLKGLSLLASGARQQGQLCYLPALAEATS